MSYNYGQNPYGSRDQAYNPHDTYGPTNDQQGGTELDHLNPTSFFGEITYLRQANQDINDRLTQIESLQQESLSRIDESSIAETSAQLDAATAEVSQMNRSMAGRIRALKAKIPRADEKYTQVDSLDIAFKQTLTRYQQVEVNHQRRAREQLARQYRIANPDATDEEIKQVQEGDTSAPVFSQAVMQNRRGAARSALAEVRSRHTEIQKIERTMVELAQLFEQMNELIVAQDPVVDNVTTTAAKVEEETGAANVHLGGAIKSARGARKKKWWCLLIAILIIIIVIIIILVTVKPWNK